MENEEINFRLKLDSLKDIPFEKYDKNSTFVLEGKRYAASRIVADLLSPKIRKMHFIDETINEFHINTDNKNDNNHFTDFLNLCQQQEIKLNSSLQMEYSKYFIQLGNIEEYYQLHPEITSTLSIEYVISRLQTLIEIFQNSSSASTSLSMMFINEEENTQFKEIISFISSHFFEMNMIELKEIPKEILYQIISSESLKIADEDSLFEFILKLYKENHEYSIFLSKIIFCNLSDESIEKFIVNFSIDDLCSEIWRSICTRLSFANMKSKEKKIEHQNRYTTSKKQNLNIECKEFEQTKEETNQMKSEDKQYAKNIVAAGLDDYNQFGVNPNNQDKGGSYSVIYPPQNLPVEPPSLLSYSSYCHHTFLITRSFSLQGVGRNNDGRMSSSLPKLDIKLFSAISMNGRDGQPLIPVSAVCGYYYTLFMFSKKGGSVNQLIFCDSDINGGSPVFLDIGNKQPLSLFGGYSHSAAISSEGEVIFINRESVKNSSSARIEMSSLPNGEKITSVACGDNRVIALSSSGGVFSSEVESRNSVLRFSRIGELSGKEFVWVSGTNDHFLAVSKEGRVFGCGSNKYGQLGLGKGRSSVSEFTEISSLFGYEIRSAYAGSSHSLFQTREGKILSCGSNYYGQLILSSGPSDDVYSPRETTITRGATFCIAGACHSLVFIGGDPPPNTPNMRIKFKDRHE